MAISFIQVATYNNTPEPWRLPPAVWTVFTALNKVHNLWRWYRRVDLYKQPDNLFQLMAGHVVNLAIGDSLLLRIAAQSLLIATRVLECTEQQAMIIKRAKEWVLAFKGRYKKPIQISLSSCMGSRFFSPSTVYFWKESALQIYHRIHRVALLTLSLGFEFFKLSMTIMDVIDVFYWSPTVKNDAINQCFVNLSKCLNQIVQNREALLTGLKSNRPLIEKLLSSTPFQYLALENAVIKTVNGTEVVHRQFQRVSKVGNGALISIGKRMVNGLSVGVGMGAIFNE